MTEMTLQEVLIGKIHPVIGAVPVRLAKDDDEEPERFCPYCEAWKQPTEFYIYPCGSPYKRCKSCHLEYKRKRTERMKK